MLTRFVAVFVLAKFFYLYEWSAEKYYHQDSSSSFINLSSNKGRNKIVNWLVVSGICKRSFIILPINCFAQYI